MGNGDRPTKESVFTTGVVTQGSDGHVAQRLEIRDLMKKKEMWTLFLLGLQRFQQSTETWVSYYDIAGIHGLPYQAWNGATGLDDGLQAAGYCTHSSVIFVTWHRPYLALFEQKLYDNVQAVLNDDKLPFKSDPLYIKAAKDLRLPYWDWARQAPVEKFPAVFGQAKIPLGGALGSIDNPLYSFVSRKRIPGGRSDHTYRYPDAKLNSHNDEVAGNLSDYTSGVSTLLFSGNKFASFSTNLHLPEQGTGDFPSIESVHDDIHGNVGGGGQMSSIGTSAFDPVFWLHHCNIDRLAAIWQALHPDESDPSVPQTWVTPGKLRSQGNFVSRQGDVQTELTPLKPFWKLPAQGTSLSAVKAEDAFWNSHQVISTEIFGYNYPETQARLSTDPTVYLRKLRVDVAGLYPSPMAAQALKKQESSRSSITKRQAAEVPSVLAEADGQAPLDGGGVAAQEVAGDSDVSHLLGPNNTYDQWVFNARTEKHILGQAYQIQVFIGDFNSDPNTWNTEPNEVGSLTILGQDWNTGCDKCKQDMESGLTITGTVELTAELIDDVKEGRLASLKPDDVVPYLTKELHWRVMLLDGTEVPRQDVRNLLVGVSSVEVTIDGDGVPHYADEHHVWRDITNGRPAGLDHGQNF